MFKALRPTEMIKAEVVDAMNHRVTANLKIVPGLTLTARYSSVFVGRKIQLEVAGGVAPFSYSVVNGSGTVDSVSGELTIGDQPGLLTVKVTDAVQGVAYLNLQVYPQQRGNPISAGFGHTCAIESGSVRCWGDNRFGQLGDGTTHYALQPTAVDSLQHKAASVTVGARHSCALLMDGSVKCWGDNSYGQLGVEGVAGVPMKNSKIPLPVLGLTQGVIAISAGNFHTCAIREGSVLCWGDNSRGQLGNILKGKTAIPVQVQGLMQNGLEVIAGAFHTCALVQSQVKCWGANQAGQLGNGLRVDTDYPVDVQGIDEAVLDIYARSDQSCALLASGKAKCWGYNSFGQLGNGGTENQLNPVEVKLDREIKELSMGTSHTCARLDSSPEVMCWGSNHSGQLSLKPDDQSHLKPEAIGALKNKVISIGAGVQHTCALFENAVSCWGDNSLGQLGSRDLKSSSNPTDPVPLN
jgi:alpha-tubulin suppressor-like RCC1 family protein